MNFIPDSYNPGIIGKNYDQTKLMMVLHFSDSRAPIPHEEEGYTQALLASQTGRVLSWLFKESHLSIDNFFITNYVKEMRPGNKSPLKKQYDVGKLILLEQIRQYSPKKIVLFGGPVNKHFFNDNSPFEEIKYDLRDR